MAIKHNVDVSYNERILGRNHNPETKILDHVPTSATDLQKRYAKQKVSKPKFSVFGGIIHDIPILSASSE